MVMYLKSGSPPLTVLYIDQLGHSEPMAHVQWQDDYGHIYEDDFPLICLSRENTSDWPVPTVH